MSRYERVPMSLVDGATAAARRLIADQKVDMSAPSATDDGVATGSPSHLVLFTQLPDAATSADMYLWLWSSTAQAWSLYSATPVALATADGYRRHVFPVYGGTKAFVQLTNMAGARTNGMNAWVERVSPGAGV